MVFDIVKYIVLIFVSFSLVLPLIFIFVKYMMWLGDKIFR